MKHSADPSWAIQGSIRCKKVTMWLKRYLAFLSEMWI